MEQLPDLHIQRPYSTLEEYLDGDFWTVERKEMFLIGMPSLELGVAVRFTIELDDGTPVVTGEGRVVEYTAPSDDFPGGLKVRFRQLDAEAKAVLRRSLEVRRRAYQAQLEATAADGGDGPAAPAEGPSAARAGDAPAASNVAPPGAEVPIAESGAALLPVAPSVASVAAVAAPTLATLATLPSPPVVFSSPPATVSVGPDLLAVSVAPARPPSSFQPPPKPRAGMRRGAKAVSAPPNRDALLGRLRDRARSVSNSAGSAK